MFNYSFFDILEIVGDAMNHKMRKTEVSFEILKEYFEKNKQGIEYRLNDEKRQEIKVGDTITFTSISEEERKIDVKVTKLKYYPDLLSMYQDNFDKDPYLQDAYETPEEAAMDNSYYTQEDIESYGLVAIYYEKQRRAGWFLVIPWLLFFALFSGTAILYTAVPSFDVDFAGRVVEEVPNERPIGDLPIVITPPPGNIVDIVLGGNNNNNNNRRPNRPRPPEEDEIIIEEGQVSAVLINEIPLIENILPGEEVLGNVRMVNNSTVPTYLRVRFTVDTPGFFIGSDTFNDIFRMNFTTAGLWTNENGWYYYRTSIPAGNDVNTMIVRSVTLLGSVGNEYQSKSARIRLHAELIEATSNRVRTQWVSTGELSESAARQLNFL